MLYIQRLEDAALKAKMKGRRYAMFGMSVFDHPGI
jgi:hypothetical protein